MQPVTTYYRNMTEQKAEEHIEKYENRGYDMVADQITTAHYTTERVYRWKFTRMIIQQLPPLLNTINHIDAPYLVKEGN